ncbi:MAG: M61 family metallopeptidase [Bacteroidetes bacterium]|nr:M61 family metallopeptidase [Bacteroidota bacterium]HET6245688.1 M61 family peptidase [Bacteroidia bacterium]
MKYLFSYDSTSQQFIDIEFTVENVNSDELMFQLPAWRPGRYELANFAKNICKWNAYDGENKPLEFQKVNKDLWKVKSKGVHTVVVKYSYYAAELNAGSTWLDEHQLYVNPVNCCFFVPDRMNEPCLIELKIPANYKVASGLKSIDRTKLRANNFQQLADSPFIASDTLQHNFFVYEGIEFHIWMQGIKNPDWAKLFSDFFIFVNEQYSLFKGFPVEDYHFIFQILPYQTYHGVEHENSTVIALGPVYDIFEDKLYNELLGISSHELFHTWNIKNIRPQEMLPYDFSKENYSKLGFVAEGFTTYYGDLMLFRSRIFSEDEFFKTFNQQLKKHFDNPGRFNYSVTQSSFDTWLDGYVQGIPNRKVSIYTEGCLIAFMLDVIIRRASENNKSLDNVMQILYNDFGKKGIGYTEKDIYEIISLVAGRPMDDFINQYAYSTIDFKPMLVECLEYLGLTITEHETGKFHETYLGFKCSEEGDKAIVKAIYPNSPADNALLIINDQIVAINGIRLNNNLDEWFKYYAKGNIAEIRLTVFSALRQKEIIVNIRSNKSCYFKSYSLKKLVPLTTSMETSFKLWAGLPVHL